MSRRTKSPRPMIPPSPEAVARAQLEAEEQKRAKLCMQGVEALLKEHGCRFHVVMQLDSNQRMLFQVSVETVPRV